MSRQVCNAGEVRVIHTHPHVSTVPRERLCFLPYRDVPSFVAFFEMLHFEFSYISFVVISPHF